MIATIKNKVSKAPEDNYTIALCDECESRCEDSKVAGETNLAASDKAIKLAHEAGWVDVTVLDPNRRRRKMAWIIKLLCPGCNAKAKEQPK